jgi:hypothetical protein
MDLPFPQIDPEADACTVRLIAGLYMDRVKMVLSSFPKDDNAVHLMGEFTFTHCLINLLKENGIKAVASTSERDVTVEKDGYKIVKFRFVRFREYI